MARIRTIKPGFFRDGDLYDAEIETGLPLRVAYAGLWTVADREGLFKWKPREIKTEVLPYDNVSMDAVLGALVKCGKVQKYESGGQEYGWIISFLIHQHVNKHEAKSTIPKPLAKKNARASTGRSPSGKERKGKEGDIVADATFQTFWDSCPKKTGRGAAEKAWAKAIELASPEIITAAMVRYAETQVGKDPAYIKTPGPWLNEKRWMDEAGQPIQLAFQNTDERGWRDRLRQFRDSGGWIPKWGPSPGEPGCKCPESILAEWRDAA